MTVDRPLRILHLEDDARDSALLQESLEAGGFQCEVTRVDTQPAFCTSLDRGGFNLIFADQTLPSFDGLSALRLARERRPEVPFIFVSGTLDEEVAIESLKIGATDYILKTKMTRIVPSVRRALREADDRARRTEAEKALRRSESYLVEAQRLSHTGSFGWNPASGTIYWSEETHRIFGVEPGTPPTLELVVQRTHPDDRKAVQATIEDAQRYGLDFEHKYRLLMPNGSVKHLHVVARAVSDEAGQSEFVGAVMDVTERQRAEEGLRESEDRFRTFVDHATDAFFLHNEELLVIDVNRQACASLGYSRAELIGIHPREFDVGLDEAMIGQLADRVSAGETVTFESFHRRKDGSVFPVEVRIGRFQRADRLYGLSLVRDITERKRTEAELSEMRERYRVLTESSLTGIYLTEGTRFVYVNPAMAKMFGYTVEELVGRGRGSLDLTCLEDRHLVAENMRRRLDAEVDELRYEFRGLRKDGSLFPVEVHGRRIELGGKVGVLGTLIDNTERQRAEEELREADSRFRVFVDHVSDAFTVHDGSGVIVDANRQACQNLGYTREELIGMHPRDFDSGVAAEEPLMEEINQRLAAGETFAFETIHRRKDGTLFPAEVRMRPFQHGGRAFGLALTRDITERKRAEEERERARRLEQEQQSAIAAERTRLAGEIHDTLAQGLAMIVMQLADAEAKLGAAWARAEKPLGVVRELAVESLAYARRSVTMLQPSAPAAGLTRAIRDVVDSGRRHFGGTLNFAATGNAVLLPASVESALAGIAREAVTNATRHSGAPQVDVELAFRDGGAVRLAVTDDGVGFDVKNIRSDGYGLASMQDRAARAGVALTFVTEPGAGTVVVASWSP
jgi:PAS domain S-box-containing protein